MLIVLAGYSATGKDTYQNKLLERNPELKRALSATTRPIRPGETDGKEYVFVDYDGYKWYSEDNQVLSERIYYTIQNGEDAVWHYGLLKQDFHNENWITILDHEGAERVRNIIGSEDVKIIYLTCSDAELKRRSKMRLDEAAEFDRRLADDRIQFIGIEDIYDLAVDTNVPHTIHDLNIEKIEELFRRDQNDYKNT